MALTTSPVFESFDSVVLTVWRASPVAFATSPAVNARSPESAASERVAELLGLGEQLVESLLNVVTKAVDQPGDASEIRWQAPTMGTNSASCQTSFAGGHRRVAEGRSPQTRPGASGRASQTPTLIERKSIQLVGSVRTAAAPRPS